MLLARLEVGPYMSNCYIVGSEATMEGIIIDPGDEPDNIEKAVKEMALTIKLIVSTHGHADHIGAVPTLVENLAAPFAMSELDTKTTSMMRMLDGRSGANPLKIDKPLSDGDFIEVGDLKFTVLHLPGHSPGGIALSIDGVVFSGDSLFQGSIGRTDFPGGNHPDLMNGIFEKLLGLPDETVVLPGHGPQTTIGMERRANPFIREWAARIKAE